MTTDAGGTDARGEELEQLRSEIEDLRTRLEVRARVRRWATVVLVVLSVLSVVITGPAVWAHETVFDTDRFMETVQPVLDDPRLYEAMSDYVADQTLEALDIEPRLTDSLTRLDDYLSDVLLDALDVDERGRTVLDRFDRPGLADLSPPIASGIETRIREAVDSFIASDEFRTRMSDIVRQTHTAAVALVRGDMTELPNVYIEEGAVRLDLIPVITDALRLVAAEIRAFLPDITLPDILAETVDQARQQVAESLAAELPPDFGQVTIMSEQRLEGVQSGAQRLDRFVWGLVLLTVLLIATSIAISPNRRRTIIQLSFGSAGGIVLALAGVRRLEAAVLAEISDSGGVEAAGALLSEVLSSLETVAVVALIIAALAASAAFLAGRPRVVAAVGEWTRSRDASAPQGDFGRWIAAHGDGLRIGIIAAAVAILFLTGIELAPVLLVAVVLLLCLWAITVAERRASSAIDAEKTGDEVESVPSA